MKLPLFDTKNQEAVMAALSMLKFRHKYFAKPENVARLKRIIQGNPSAHLLIDEMHKKQLENTRHMDFSKERTGNFKRFQNVIQISSVSNVDIETSFAASMPKELLSEDIQQMLDKINQNVAESLNGLKIKLESDAINVQRVKEILRVAWVVEHFALVLLGALSVEVEGNSFVFKLMKSGHFNSLWFGSALESSSILAGSAAITKLAEATHKIDPNDEHDIRLLHARVLSLIPQHWRLGAAGQSTKLFHEIADLVILLMNVVQRNRLDNEEVPFTRREIEFMDDSIPQKHSLLSTYDYVLAFQQSCKSEDRVVEIKNDGLVLGPVETIRGLIQQIEYIALQKQGENWHGQLEDEQTDYLLDELEECSHLDVLRFEFKPEHFDDSEFPDLRLDVDFFIRDKSINTVYAVQLKHVKYINEAGFLRWIKLVGIEDKKLNSGILQLERLNEVVQKSQSARNYLKSKGLSESEIMNLKPIVVHNEGSLDCITMQSGICLYDLYTFKKALSGCRGTVERYDEVHYTSKAIKSKSIGGIDVSNPDNVISSYLGERHYYSFRFYDAAKHLTRSVFIDSFTYKAEGIGI